MGLSKTVVTEEKAGIYRISARFIHEESSLTLTEGQALGVFLHTNGHTLPQFGPVPCCASHFDTWPGQAVAEVWTSNRPVTYLSNHNLRMAHDGETLMGVVTVEDASGNLEPLAFQAYSRIFEQVYKLDYPILFRMWNYFPGINQTGEDGLERYRSFCKGRADAFFEGRRFRESYLPAGTGIGTRSGSMSVAFMASRTDHRINLENPRQVPAYHYPRNYGPRSPSFARGTFIPRAGGGEFYVSGTASIVGHETLFTDDLERQCATAFENIALLMDGDNLAKYGIKHHITTRELDQVRIYVRNPEDVDRVREYCRAFLNPKAHVVYLGADICRSPLLVEIEGVVFLDDSNH